MDSSTAAGSEHGESSGSGGGGASGISENANNNNNNSNKDKVHIPIRKIYIHPIPLNMIDKIRAHFEAYGEVESFNACKKGDFRFGFVQFKDAAVVETILLKKRHRIGRCVINVRAAYRHQQPDYASIMSNPLMIPPDQDDDNHIVKALNADCFREIFKRLDLPDLVNVAEVCTCFNREAKETFASSKYKHMAFTGTEFSDHPNKMRKAMRHFGDCIRSLCIESKSRADDYLLRAILEFCTEKLTELRLEFFHIQEESPDLGPLFSRLEKLELMNCNIYTKLDRALADCAELKVLRLDSCQLEPDDEGIGRAFVNLQEGHFAHTSINAEIFQHFIVSNPGVTKLTINQVFDEARTLSLIGQNMPNLQELEFIESNYSANFQDDVLSIGQLAHLRVLKLHFNWLMAAPLLNALCTNNVPIEHLKMVGVWIDDNAAESILKMTQMKVLEVFGARDLTNDHLIGFAKGLAELQELRLASAADLTTMDLKKIVSHASKLKFMKLRSCGNFTIGVDDYNVMLHTVQNRREKANLLIEVESDGEMVNVPEETLNEHRTEFFIDEQELEREIEAISNDSNDMHDEDSWYDGMDYDQDDFDDFDYYSDADNDDDAQPAGFLNGRQVYLG